MEKGVSDSEEEGSRRITTPRIAAETSIFVAVVEGGFSFGRGECAECDKRVSTMSVIHRKCHARNAQAKTPAFVENLRVSS